MNTPAGVAATGGATAPSGTQNTKPKDEGAKAEASFGAVLDKAAKTLVVKGHDFRKVASGEHKDSYVNRSGNERDGHVFQRVWRDGRCFHVYGEGKDRAVFEVTPEAKAHAGGAAPAAPAAGDKTASA